MPKKESSRKGSGDGTPVRRSRARKAAAEPAAPAPSVRELTPNHEEIARLAHSYWEARGRRGGSPEEDWLRAEQEIRRQRELSTK